MHPAIYQFWANNGYQVRFVQRDGDWVAEKHGDYIRVACRSFLNITKNRVPDYYIWNGERVSEEYMLKIIKMKAFL